MKYGPEKDVNPTLIEMFYFGAGFIFGLMLLAAILNIVAQIGEVLR